MRVQIPLLTNLVLNLVLALFAGLSLALVSPFAAQCQDKDSAAKARLTEKVEMLSRQAKELRKEFKFQEAEEVERTIRELCLELDPRFVRGNELKQRSVQARLKGNMDDANLFDREADRLFAEVKKEFSRRAAANDDPFANDQADAKGTLPKAAVNRQELEMKEKQIAELTLRLKNVMRDLQAEQEHSTENRSKFLDQMNAMEVRLRETQRVVEEYQKRMHDMNSLVADLKKKLAKKNDK